MMPLSPRMLRDELQDLPAAAGARAHGEAQVGPVEAVHEHLGRLREQPGQDVGAGGGIGGRRERDRLQRAELVLQRRQGHVFGAEIVSPLRDAMGLVDRQHADPGALEQRNGVGLGEPLGRHIDEAQFAAGDLVQDGAVLVEIIVGVQARGRDAVALELRHLVAHERDQRRHHDGEPIAHQRRQLIAQRLAAAGRHHGQHVAAGQDGLDDLGLAVAELREAEYGAQQVVGGGEIGHDGFVLRLGDGGRAFRVDADHRFLTRPFRSWNHVARLDSEGWNSLIFQTPIRSAARVGSWGLGSRLGSGPGSACCKALKYSPKVASSRSCMKLRNGCRSSASDPRSSASR